jgi:general secretion pathway protein D
MEDENMRWLLLVFLMLLLMVGALSCSGAKAQLKGEPGGETLQKPMDKPPETAAAASSEKAKTIPGEKVEVSRPEKLPAPQILPPRREVVLPAPATGPPPPPPPAVKPAETAKGSKFVLNFDNADLYEVIRVMAEMMKMNYVIDPRVKGVVNIHTSGQISAEEVFPIFQSILKLNGATAVQKGPIYEVVPFGDAKKLYTAPVTPKEGGVKVADEKYAIQIIALKYIPVSEVSKIIKPFLSDGADIVEHPPHNILIIGDTASNVKKSLDIIDLFDIDIFADMRLRLYPILHADVNEIAKEMERIFSSFEVSLKSARGVGITFTPVTRINSLLVVSAIPNIFDRVETWLKELDKTPGMARRISVFVYYVQNGKAKDMAEVLKQVYLPPRAQVPGTVAGAPGIPASQQRLVRPTPATPTPPGQEAAPLPPGAVPEGEINIVVDETTNALIIRAYQRDYQAILEIIKKLDLYPKQAFIEVLLAEVTLDDLNKFGLEFSTFQDTFTKGATTYGYTVGMGGTPFLGIPGTFSSGLRYTLAATDKLTAAIHASATENRLKVISSPHILASNNKEARIQIGTSQPILTNTYTTTATGTPGVVEGSIEYKDTGIILTVTPRISDGGLVTLEISIESSTVATTALGNLSSIPVFNKKTAKTTLSIMEGQTIVMGGLIEETKNETTAGVPFLSRIPILGALFGYQTYEKKKVETLLLMTPHVITDLDQSKAITKEFRDKVGAIKKEVEMRERERMIK